jgi:putative nucleotidyltransferase with HDIG domain
MAQSKREKERILQIASAIGRIFEVELLGYVLNVKETEVLKSVLEDIRSERLIHRSRKGKCAYGFARKSIREDIYSGLTNTGRKRLHGTIARSIEKLYQSDIESHHEDLAFHYSRSSQPEKAAHYYRILGDSSLEDYRAKDSVRYYEKAIESTEDTKQTPLIQDLRLNLMIKSGEALFRLGRVKKATEKFNRAIELSEQLKNPKKKAYALRQIGRISKRSGRWAQALKDYNRALRIYERLKDLQGIADTCVNIGAVYFERGIWKLVLRYFKRALKIAKKINDKQLVAMVYNNLGIVLNIQGEWEKAIEYYNNSIHMYTEVNDLAGVARTYHNMGMIYADKKIWAEADRYFEKCLTIANQTGDMSLIASVNLNRVEIYLHLPMPEKAKALVDMALKGFKHIDDPLGVAECHKFYGVIYGQEKQWNVAEDHLRRSINLYSKFNSPLGLAETQREMALLFKSKGEEEKALPLLGKSLILFRDLKAKKDIEQVDEIIDNVEKLYLGIAQSIGAKVEAKDPYTLGHIDRVAHYAFELAKALHLSEDDMKGLIMAAFLHDIGKIRVPDEVLLKPGRLTPEEFDEIKKHPVHAIDMLEDVEFPWEVKPLVRGHHERYDGKGYPDGLSGENIPLGARIITVVDFFDAMTTDRPYRPAWTVEDTVSTIESEIERMFDARIARTFVRVIEQEKEIRKNITGIEFQPAHEPNFAVLWEEI